MIQSFVRMKQKQTAYKNKKIAALIIQRRFRAKLLAVKERNEFLITRRSCVVLQSSFRMILQRKKFLRICRVAVLLQRRYRALLLARKQREAYLNRKKKCILLQTLFRKTIARRHYLKTIESVVMIQKHIKGFVAQKQYKELRKSTILLQRSVRNWKIAKELRNKYLTMREAAIVIQSQFRGFLVRQKFKKQREACVFLQACFKSYIARKQFVEWRKSAIVIQRHYRALKLGQDVRSEYLLKRKRIVMIQSLIRCYLQRKLHEEKVNAAIIIQTHFRSWISSRKVQIEYRNKRKAAIIIQTFWQAYQAKKECLKLKSVIQLQAMYRGYRARKKYALLKKLTTTVQRTWRTILEKKKIRLREQAAAVTIQKNYRRYKQQKSYHQMLSLVVKLQSCIRGHLVRMHILSKRIKAAVVIQKAARLYLARKQLKALIAKRQKELEDFAFSALRNLSAIRIQRCYRKYSCLKYGRIYLQSVIVIQRWFQATLQRQRFLKFRSSLCAFQRAAVVYIERRSKAATFIQSFVRSWIFCRKFCKMKISAIIIQSVWRGYKIRCGMQGKIILGVRKRIRIATARATEDMTLGNRVSAALDFLLKYKTLSHLLAALKHLDVAARLSSICCERLVDAGGPQILMQLISSCNRSLPHMELIKYSTSILLNVAKHNKTVNSIWEIQGSVDIILDLMSIFREKGSSIFTKSCTLLWILCQERSRAQEIQRNDVITNKICSIHYLLSRKQKMDKQRQVVKAKMSASSFLWTSMSSVCYPKENPEIQPDWKLGKHLMREFEDPLEAINAVMKTLCLKKKQVNVGTKICS